MVRPKKHLGQHFLHDRAIASRIASLVPDHAALVLEIGPGTGVLTQHLLPRFGQRMLMVEIDPESVDYLKQRFALGPQQLLHADFLELDLERFAVQKMVVVGNFPYNISSQIFFRIIEARQWVDEVVCMIQLEVAQRIAAPPGSKTYGILSVLLQLWFDVRMVFEVGPGAFVPPPKVQSAVVRLKRNNVENSCCDVPLLHKVVKLAFNQRRKTLRNALSSLVPRHVEHPLLLWRAEQLSVDNFIQLTAWISDVQHEIDG